MADHYKKIKKCLLSKSRVIDVSFAPAGTGAPTNLISTGFHALSVTRTGVGAFLLTFTGVLPTIAALIAQVGSGSLQNLVVQAGAIQQVAYPVDTGSIPLTVMSGATGTATDMAAAAGNTIFLKLILDPTTVRPA